MVNSVIMFACLRSIFCLVFRLMPLVISPDISPAATSLQRSIVHDLLIMQVQQQSAKCCHTAYHLSLFDCLPCSRRKKKGEDSCSGRKKKGEDRKENIPHPGLEPGSLG